MSRSLLLPVNTICKDAAGVAGEFFFFFSSLSLNLSGFVTEAAPVDGFFLILLLK